MKKELMKRLLEIENELFESMSFEEFQKEPEKVLDEKQMERYTLLLEILKEGGLHE